MKTSFLHILRKKEVFMQYGTQTIGCQVTNCVFHTPGNFCRLNSITVQPTHRSFSGTTGESFCGSYAPKME